MLRLIILLLLTLNIFSFNANASQQVLNWPGKTPIIICQPSDTNANCGGGGGGGVGVGTVNTGSQFQVAYYASTGTTISGSSILSVNSNNVGIGSIVPTQKLDVNGTVNLQGISSNNLKYDGTNLFMASGNIGIGTTSTIQGPYDFYYPDTNTTVTSPQGANLNVYNASATTGNFSDILFGTKNTDNSVGLTSMVRGINTGNVSGSNSGQLAFLTKNSGPLHEGMRIIENGNVGIGTINPTQKLDVNGNIAIVNNGNNTTKGTFQGINTAYEYWPPTGSGNVVDVVNSVVNHPNQLAISSNNANSPGAMALWNSAITNGATLHVTGVTTAPAHNATYTNGTCTQTVYSSDLSGTAGALTGLIATRTNCTLAASGTLTKTGGTGDSSLTYGSITWEHNVSSMIGMPAGFYGAGDELHPELQDDGFVNPEFAIGYGVIARDTQGDSSFHMACGQHAPFSSGCGYFANVMNDDGTSKDRVGNWFGNVQAGVPLMFDGGWNMNLFNPASTNPRGYGIAMSSGPGLDSGGNFAGLFVDTAVNLGTHIPWWQAHVHVPGSKSWIFTVSGVTTAPGFSGNTLAQYNISSSKNYDWVKNNLSGGSGTITFESLATPPSSGTLTQNITDGISIGVGDATITYSSVVEENEYKDTMFFDQLHGNVGIDTFKPTQTLDVIGTVKATKLIDSGITGSTQCLQADSSGNITGTGSGCGGSGSTPGGGQNAVQYNNSSSFSGSEASFSFNGTNVGIGTSNATAGILDIRNGNVGIGTQFSINQGGTKLISSVGAKQSYFIGDGAGNYGITGGDAICVGQNSCPVVGSGGDIFCGNTNSCKALTTGGDVIAIGTGAGAKTTTDSHFIWLGSGAGANFNDTTGNGNMIGIGQSAQGSATNGFQDNCAGTGCMGTTSGNIGQQNNCFGSACLPNVTTSSQYLWSAGDSAGNSLTSAHDVECEGADSCATHITSGHDDFIAGGHVDAPANLSNFVNIENVLYMTGAVEGSAPSATANVGIGTATPRNALDVIGTAQMTGFSLTTNPTSGYVLTTNSIGIGTWAPAPSGGGSGTVTTVSVVSANGLAGTVANATTTPAITLSTSITGLLKGNGTSISSASSGTDYAPATSGSSYLIGNGSGGFTNATSTGSGNNVLATSPTLITPVLGAATGTSLTTSGNIGIGTTFISNAGLSVMSGNVGIGTWIPSAQLDLTGTGNAYFGGNVGIGSLAPGQLLDVQGNVRIKLGSTLTIVTGSNACKGQATLTSGTATVSTSCTPSTSEGIFLTDATTGTLTNVGSQTVGTVTGGTSFVINSTNVLDASKVNWVILTSS